VLKTTAGHNEEQKKLYHLIWQRTVASQMADAKMLRTKLTADIRSGEIPNFHINGSRILFEGWLKADPASRQDDVELPKVSVGEIEIA
jgi:DNA topoisomerase-1